MTPKKKKSKNKTYKTGAITILIISSRVVVTAADYMEILLLASMFSEDHVIRV
jgi:hypothetical protein